MYKDVKKKLLSVALCICMVIGAVQVVPRAKAAATVSGDYYPITVGVVGTSDTKTVYVHLASPTTYTYNGSAHAPEIDAVVTDTSNPQGTSILGNFQTALNIVEGSTTDAGKFYGLLASKDSTYSVSDTESNRIEFTIDPATVTDMQVTVDADILKYTDGGVQPTVSEVVLTTNSSEEITYTGADIENNFSIGKITTVGKNQESEIELKSNSNFTNTYKTTAKCTVAYDLGNSAYAKLDSTSVQYTGADLSSQITISVYDKNGSSIKENINKTTLQTLKFVFKKDGNAVTEVSQAGTYTVEVTPSTGAAKAVAINGGSLYTGTFVGTFTVGLKSGVFKVQAYDNDTSKMKTLTGTDSLYRISVNEKNGDGEILPRDLTVDIDDVRIYDYDLTFTDVTGKSVRPTKAGQYNMTITPKASTNYGGSVTVRYYVYSELSVSTIQFRNVPGDNPVELSYNGSGYEIQNIVVKDTAGNTLVQGTHFTVEYQYKSGDNWISAQTYSDPNMLSVGSKQILVVGKNAYQGEKAEWQYSIAKVAMEGSSESQYFELEWVKGASYNYRGSAITPQYTFKYRNAEIDRSYYTEIWESNTNAGGATLTVSATANSPFTGSLSLGFTINALSLSKAKCIGDGVDSDASKYSYTGTPLSPQLKIDDYELKSSDYTITGYKTSAGTDLGKTAPTEPGTYQMLIESANSNITGSATINYSIIQRDISNDNGASFYLSGGTPVEWQGGVTEPEVICGSMSMVKGTDYEVTYADNTAPTTTVSASAIITGKGYFTGTKKLYFDISKRKISNANVKITSSVTGTAPNYVVTFNAKDEGVNVVKKALEENTDYKITKVIYETEDDYTPAVSDLSKLERAGKYIVTIAGQNNYEGTTDIEVLCGTDISDATVSVGKETLTYNGKPQWPTIKVKVGNQSAVQYKKGDANAPFSLVFSRAASDDVPMDYENIYAGTVIVQAVGNTKKGYYGTTKASATYEIQPMDISKSSTRYTIDFTNDLDKESIDGKRYAHYKFTNKKIVPQEEVIKDTSNTAVSAAAILVRDVDYMIAYGDDCISQGPHTITVTGMGNFTGSVGTKFYIDAMGIGSDDIVATFTTGSTYADGVPKMTLKLNGSVELKDAALYTEGADYQVNVTRADPDNVGWNDTYVYSITGLGNFAGTTRKEEVKVTQTTLNRPADSKNPQAKDTYVSAWDYDELIISPGAIVPQPSKFTLTYKRTDGTTYNLEPADYNIKSFIPTKKSGEGSTMVIEGKGGFNGEATYDVPLFTDITKAEYLKDSEGNEASVLRPDGTITVDALATAIENNKLSELVTFKNIWPDDVGGTIPTDCYIVTVPNGYTPKIGKVTLTVSGNHDKYYTGTMSFDVNVTGELSEELTTVEIGDNNIVPWKGVTVTPGAVKVQVKAGTKILKGGYVGKDGTIPSDWDYTVTFSDNTGVGLATATITGVNTYSGTLTRNFKITCSYSELVVSLQNLDGSWTDYDGGSPAYAYQIETERNKPAVKLFYKHADNTLSELGQEYYSLTYSGYQGAGNAKLVIGEPENTNFKGILLGTSRVVNYTLTPISLDDVSIGIATPQPVYTGNEMNAADIGLTLTYGSYTLTDADYALIFKDAVNADVVDGKAARVIITAKGNFSGTVEKEFNIQPMPIGSQTDINAVAETLIYTGEAQAPKLTVNQVTGRIRTLTEGTDYEIVAYMDETKKVLQDNPFAAIGTYYVRIKGLGNYTSSVTRDIQYEIVTREVTDGLTISFVDSAACPVLNGVPTCVYNGNPHEPSVRVTYNDKILNGPDDSNPEYELTYSNNTNAGKATVEIAGVGSFAGTKTVDFTIQPKDITGTDIDYRDKDGNEFQNDVSYDWTKATVHPEINIYDRSRNQILIVGDNTTTTADYSIRYDDDNGDSNTQANAGLVTMTITGQNNYTGTQEFTYYIGEDISKAYTLVNGSRSVTTTYNGLEQAPAENSITVEKGSSALTLVDENGENRYDIAYYKNGFDKANKVERDQIIDAATYYIAVVGVPSKGTYAKTSESNSCAYTIYPRSIAPSYVLVSGYDGSYYYTGQPIEPKAITVEDTDLPVTSDQADPQRRSVKLVSGTDYDISYTNNTSAGKASIIVTGKGNYSGNRVAYFNIVSSNTDGNNTWNGTSEGTGSISNGSTTISAKDIILGYDSTTYNCMMYNGYERIPTVSINGLSNSDFVITASNNIRPGVATLMITGINNYTGTIYKNYTIKADLSTYGTVSTIVDQSYTGYQITPYVTVTCGGNLLTVGNDYTVTYANNTNVGRATVIATAAANSYYVGTANGYFNISNTATGMEITGYASSYTYTGNAITPDVIVTMNGRMLNRGTDYVVSYSNNTNVGTATMTVTGIGSFSGTKTINYVIEAKNIENCITTAVNNYQYTGNTYTPSVTLTDSSTGKTLAAGTDYTITYSNNTNPGTASITVTALSRNYTGSKVISFKITSAAVSGLRVSRIKNNSMKLSWSDQDYADGYQICNANNRVIGTTSNNSYTVKRLTSCTTYRYKVRSYVENADGSVSYGNFSTAVAAQTMLNTPTLKARSTTRGNVTLTWSKVAKASGYEIYYSTEKNGIYTKLKTVSKSSARRYVDSGLASGEKYYYTIRAYRTVNGVKTYSSYNTIKSATVK